MMLALITTISLIAIFYAYFGYPLLLQGAIALNGGRAVVKIKPNTLPIISIIITIRNEKTLLREKIEQTLSLSYFGLEKERVEIIIASDASDDGSDEIARSYQARGVMLASLKERGGKEVAQGEALKIASGEIILFTDAKISLNSDALEKIAPYFSDLTVGVVSSLDRITHGDREGSGEGFYIRYEMWLRRLESAFGSLVGVSGSAFAVRKEICSGWREDIPSDFALLISSQQQGLRGVLAEDFIGSYQTVKTEEEEFSRKVRTILRGITTFFCCAEILNFFKYGVFSWQIASHKLCRWLVPFFILTATIGLLSLSGDGGVFSFLALAVVAGYAVAGAAYVKPQLRKNTLCKAALFFLISNTAIFLAWFYYLSGKRSVTWNPSQKGL